MPSESKGNDPYAALRITEFRNLMTGRFLFIMGLRMMGTLVGWWVYELTNDPFAIGLIGLAEVIPAVSLSLYAGHVIDVGEKRKILLRGVVAYFSCVVALILLSGFGGGRMSTTMIAFCIYVVIFLTGVFRAFTGPTFSTIVGQVVPRELLANAITWNQGIWLAASVLGHALVGFLIVGIGNTRTLVVICLFVTVGFFYLRFLRPREPLSERGEKKTLESVKEGLRFVFSTKEVLGALSLDLFAVLFGGAVAMIPVFARDILKTGPVGFGWLNAATDIGSIIVVVLMTLFPMRRQQGKNLLYAVGGFGLCIIVFGLSRNYWLSFAVLVLSGILDGVSMIIRGTIVQIKTPDHMRGRVMSVNSMFINSSNELGQFESGVASKLMGVVPSVVFGGMMTIVVVAITWFKAPSLRKMEY
jgi:MFS family permease